MSVNKQNIGGLLLSVLCFYLICFGLTTERGKGSPLLGFLYWATVVCILLQLAIMAKKRS